MSVSFAFRLVWALIEVVVFLQQRGATKQVRRRMAIQF
jgi:hypothetical protein